MTYAPRISQRASSTEYSDSSDNASPFALHVLSKVRSVAVGEVVAERITRVR